MKLRTLLAPLLPAAVLLLALPQDRSLDHLEPLDHEVTLFDGGDLREWVLFTGADVPQREGLVKVEEGVLRIAGKPTGYLQTRRWYRDYTLDLEWRWPGERGGNSGVLVHATTPLLFFDWPRSMEVQLQSGSAGDFWVIGEGVDIEVPDRETRRRAPVEGNLHSHRRIQRAVKDAEYPVGEWNAMRVECRGDRVTVWVNDQEVNAGTRSTVTEGGIALQSEGTPIEFRSIRLSPLGD